MNLKLHKKKMRVMNLTNNFPLYDNALLRMELVANPTSKGHIKILPVKEMKSLDEISQDDCEQLFFGASYAATALFELLGAQGTNIILNESDDQLCIDVVSRSENDGLNFLWQPTKADPNELSDLAKSIKNKADQFVWERDHPEEAKKAKQSLTPGEATEIKKETDDAGNEKKNYLLRSLRRTP